MEIKLFYKTQRELAEAINKLIDAYWNDSLNEGELIADLTMLYDNNRSKIKKNEAFTTILKQQCGKRRLEVFERVLSMQLK